MLAGMWAHAQAKAESAEPKTFLFKISGNGLAKPSYLWGTIHRTEEELFNFPDSLYHFLEASDTYVMEVHADSLFNYSITKGMKDATRQRMANKLSPAQLQAFKKEWQSLLDSPLEDMTLSELVMKIGRSKSTRLKGKTMPLMMDVYLFSLAKKMSKRVAALETMQQQAALLDSFLQKLEPAEVLSQLGKNAKLIDLNGAYLQFNLPEVAKLVQNMPASWEGPFLSVRNTNMLAAMEPIMRSGSAFVAVGVAHLPGSSGLVQLLRQAGYDVTPVFSKKRLLASKYTPPAADSAGNNDWTFYRFEESGYGVSFPDTPTTNSISSSNVVLRTCTDWRTSSFYLVTQIPVQKELGNGAVDSIMEQIIGTVGKVSSKTKAETVDVTANGLQGKSVTLLTKDGWTRVDMYSKGNIIFNLTMSAKKAEDLQSARAAKFFQSLKVFERKQADQKTFSSSSDFFAVDFPGEPLLDPDHLKSEEDSNATVKETTLYLQPPGTSTELMVQVTRLTDKAVALDGRLAFSEVVANLKGKEVKRLVKTDTSWLQYPACFASGILQPGIRFDLRMLKRGGRVYFLWYFDNERTFSNLASQAFFESFRLLPYPATLQATSAVLDSVVVGQVDGKAGFKRFYNEVDSSTILSYSSLLAATMHTVSGEFSRYAWASSDSAWLAGFAAKALRDEKGRELKRQFSSNGSYPSLDITMILTDNGDFLRMNVVKAGNRWYRQQLQADSAMVFAPVINEWFRMFRIDRSSPAFDLTKQTAEEYFKRLASMPTDEFEVAVRQMDELPFSREHLPLLYRQVGTKWIRDTSYPSLYDNTWDVIQELVDSTDVSDLQMLYEKADTATACQLDVLKSLVKIGTTPALSVVQRGIPFASQQAAGQVHQLFYALGKNTAAAKTLLPQWSHLLADTTYGGGLLYLYKTLEAADNEEVDKPDNYAEATLALGRWLLSRLKMPEYDFRPFASDVLSALANLRSPAGDALLYDISIQATKSSRYYAYEALKLLMSKDLYPQDAINLVAADPNFRLSLYKLLADEEQESLMDARFRTQQMMAESYIHEYNEDYDLDTLIAVGERELMFMGIKCRYFLFKAPIKDEEGKITYQLAVAGPFALDKKSLLLFNDSIYLVGVQESEYDKKTVDKLLMDLVKQSALSGNDVLLEDEERR
ncbi:MAG: TraB/GumN family protein [Chitinophagaceae bacterium]|jgi:uncharacterized protein YbaP (TraB family)|nr:TraB/GumN family protein [Chitinophagaceae bacterium]